MGVAFSFWEEFSGWGRHFDGFSYKFDGFWLLAGYTFANNRLRSINQLFAMEYFNHIMLPCRGPLFNTLPPAIITEEVVIN